MAIDPDPRTHVASTEDFYSLLSLPVTDFAPEELRRAYRKTAARYHPDKAVKPGASDAEKEAARERWDLFEVAHKVLQDPDLRAQYDNARTARQQKAKRHAELDAHRRHLVEQLERREREAARGAKREAEEADEEAREKARLNRDFERRRDALNERRKAEMRAAGVAEEDESVPADEDVELPAATYSTTAPTQSRQATPSFEKRTVKVRFPESVSTQATASQLETVFAHFGKVDTVITGKVKKQRLRPDDRRRRPVAVSYVSFEEQQSALEAVARWKTTVRDDASLQDWARELDISWMGKNKDQNQKLKDDSLGNSEINNNGTEGEASIKEAIDPRSYKNETSPARDFESDESLIFSSYRAGPVYSDDLNTQRHKIFSRSEQKMLDSRAANVFAKAGGTLEKFEKYVLGQMKSTTRATTA